MSIYLGTTPLSGLQNLNTKADINLGNLNSTGKNISNWSTNVTNCITYIPQDIKLELNNGTLTLKAGSKVYVPNGAGVFDEVVIASDIIIPGWANNAQGMLSIKPSTSGVWIALMNQQYSGSTMPTSSQYELWYDTNSNKVKTTSNTGSTWGDGYSLPLALITSNGSSWTSIDQIFNGFGYIGSTVFALPGVKGLIPNGRNDDGSLKNTLFTLESVKTFTQQYSQQNLHWMILNPNYGIEAWDALNWIGYNEKLNYVYDKNGSSSATFGRIIEYCVVANVEYIGSSNVSSFTPKTVFHALDWNDRAIIEEQLPSSGNNYLWYRKYSSGFVEQGGVIPLSLTATNTTIAWSTSLPVAMKNNNYTVNVSILSGWITEVYGGLETVTTTSISGYIKTSSGDTPRGADMHWYVAGLYA